MVWKNIKFPPLVAVGGKCRRNISILFFTFYKYRIKIIFHKVQTAGDLTQWNFQSNYLSSYRFKYMKFDTLWLIISINVETVQIPGLLPRARSKNEFLL